MVSFHDVRRWWTVAVTLFLVVGMPVGHVCGQSNRVYSVSQELGIDGNSFVLLEDYTVTGGSTIIIRLDQLALPAASLVNNATHFLSAQKVYVQRCTFSSQSTLVLRGPNKAVGSSGAAPELHIVIENSFFVDSSAIVVTGSFQSTVMTVRTTYFASANMGLASTSSMAPYLSSGFSSLSLGTPCILFRDVVLLSGTVVQLQSLLTDSTYANGAGILVAIDSASLSTSASATQGYGLSISSGSALLIQRCNLWLISASISAAVAAIAPLLVASGGAVIIEGNRVASVGGGVAGGFLLGPWIVSEGGYTVGSAPAMISGTVVLQSNAVTLSSITDATSTVVISVDFRSVSVSGGVLLLLRNTLSTVVSSTVPANGQAPSCRDVTLPSMVLLPTFSANGVTISLVSNVVDDSATASRCTSLAAFVGSASGSVSTSKLAVKCNTYDAATWTSYPAGSGSSYQLISDTCASTTCFVGDCATLSTALTGSSCQCVCGGGHYGSLCIGGVDVQGILHLFATATRTNSAVVTPSQKVTLTRTLMLTSTVDPKQKVSRTSSSSPSQGLPSGSRTVSARKTVTVVSFSRIRTMTFSRSRETPSISAALSSQSTTSSPSTSPTDGSASFTSMSPQLSSQSHTATPSTSITLSATISAAMLTSTETSTKSAPSLSSDSTQSSSPSTSVSVTVTISRRPSPTRTVILTPTSSHSPSWMVTASFTGNRSQSLNSMSSSITLTDTATLSASLTDLRSHMLFITKSPTATRNSPTSSPTPSLSGSFSLTVSETNTTTRRHSLTLRISLSPTKPSASRDLMSVSLTSSFASSVTRTETQTLTYSNSPETLTDARSLTLTESRGWISNTTSMTQSLTKSHDSVSYVATKSVSLTQTQSMSSSKFTVDSSKTNSGSATPSSSASVTQHRSQSLSMSMSHRSDSVIPSASNSVSAAIASTTVTRQPPRSKTGTPSSALSNSVATPTASTEVSLTHTLIAEATSSSSKSSTVSNAATMTLDTLSGTESTTLTLSASEETSETRTQTISRSQSKMTPSISKTVYDSATMTVTLSVSPTRSPSLSSSRESISLDNSMTWTSTRTASVSADPETLSESRDVTASQSPSRSPPTLSISISRDRQHRRVDSLYDGLLRTPIIVAAHQSLSLSITSSLPNLTHTRSLSSTESNTSTPTITYGTMSQGISRSLSTSISEMVTRSPKSPSISLSITTTTSSSLQIASRSVSSSISSVASMSIPSFSATITASETPTMHRSHSRQLSRSRSVTVEYSETNTVRPSFTRTFHHPVSNLASFNAFQLFQQNASPCVQIAVYAFAPLALILALESIYFAYRWSDRRRRRVDASVDTYRSVPWWRSLVVLHVYASLLVPCHYRCAVLHTLITSAYVATWTVLLQFFMMRFASQGPDTAEGISIMITMLLMQIFKPLVHMTAFYYKMDETEDRKGNAEGALADRFFGGTVGRAGSIFGGSFSNRSFNTRSDPDDDIDLVVDDDEVERFRRRATAASSVDNGGEKPTLRGDDTVVAGASPLPPPEAPADGVESMGVVADDGEIFFDIELDDSGANGSASFASGPNPDVSSVSKSPDVRSSTKKSKKKKRRKHAPSEGGQQQEGAAYGFGEMDHFVLFHDDYDAFHDKGHQLRLQEHFEDHQGTSSDPHLFRAQSAAEGDTNEEAAAITANGDKQTKVSNEEEQETSSCVSIEVDEDEEAFAGGLVGLSEDPVASRAAVKEDDEISVSEPRSVSTMHIPLHLLLVSLIAVDLYLITYHYNQSSLSSISVTSTTATPAASCSTVLYHAWWVFFLCDALIMESFVIPVLVLLFRWILREPHEETTLRNAKMFGGLSTSSSSRKLDLRWWKGSHLHPYDNETRYQ